MQRGENRVEDQEEGADAGNRDAGHGRPVAADRGSHRVQRLLGQIAQARRDEGVVARPIRQGTAGPVARDRRVYEAGIALAQALVVDAQTGGDPGAERL